MEGHFYPCQKEPFQVLRTTASQVWLVEQDCISGMSPSMIVELEPLADGRHLLSSSDHADSLECTVGKDYGCSTLHS